MLRRVDKGEMALIELRVLLASLNQLDVLVVDVFGQHHLLAPLPGGRDLVGKLVGKLGQDLKHRLYL